MDKNTLYLYEYEKEVVEFNIHFQKRHIITLDKLYNNLCLKELTTLKGRIDAIKKIFSYSYNVPIYINHDLVFVKMYTNEKIWINVVNIIDIIKKDSYTYIIFKEGKILLINKNFRTVKNIYEKALEIVNYKNGFIL